MMEPQQQEWSDRSFGHILAVYAAVLIGILGATVLLAWLLPMQLERAFLIVFGIFTIAGAYWKPWWYWEHRGGWLARWILGDRLARIFFFAIGVAMLFTGLFVKLPPLYR